MKFDVVFDKFACQTEITTRYYIFTYLTEDQRYLILSYSIITDKSDHLNLIYGGHWFKLRGTLTKVRD